MNLTLWDQPDALDRLRAPWSALFDRCPDAPIFLSWEWASTWWAHFQDGRRPHILTIEEGNTVLAVVPLMSSPDGSRLAFLGNGQTTDYADLLVTGAEQRQAVAALMGYLKDAVANGSAAILEPIPAESALLDGASDGAGPIINLHRLETCPTVSLPDTWEGYLARLSRTDRHELRRKMRRAESAGQLVCNVAVDPQQVLDSLPSFFRLHQSSADPRKAQFLELPLQHFFTEVSVALAGRGWLRLSTLQLDGADIASVLSFDRESTVALYNSGFDPQYRPISPGLIIIAHELQSAIERGRRTYDFLRGDEPYKYDFGAEDRFVWRMCLGLEAPLCTEDGSLAE